MTHSSKHMSVKLPVMLPDTVVKWGWCYNVRLLRGRRTEKNNINISLWLFIINQLLNIEMLLTLVYLYV